MDAFLGSANKYFLYMFNEVFDKGVSIDFLSKEKSETHVF